MPWTRAITSVEDPLVLGEEPLRDGFDVVGASEGGTDVAPPLHLVVDAGDLLRDGPTGLVAADDHAAQDVTAVLRVGVDEVDP